MSLFGGNYSKPGKGVDKNAPKKGAFFQFWELFARKFFKYVVLNLMYIIIILPIFIFLYGMLYAWLSTIITIETETIVSPLLEVFRLLVAYVPQSLHIPLVALSLILYGPFTAGLTYILRNYAREEHAWISDFFTKAFQNLRQGIVFGLIDIAACLILYINWNYAAFTGADTVKLSLFAVFLRYFTAVLFVFYVFMRYYIYQMVVTAELSIRAILKNSVIFAILGLGRNIIATLALVLTTILVLFVHPLIELLGVILLFFSFISFVAVFTTYPIIERYIIKPALESEESVEDNIDELIGNRGGVLPPELGGPGAGAINEVEETDSETNKN